MSDELTTKTRNLAEEIQQDYAEAWRPNAGDSIIGRVQDITTMTTEFGEYPIVTLVLPDSKRGSVHAFHTTLMGALIDAEPSIGEEIAIKYNGLRHPKESLVDGKPTAAAVKKEGTKDDPRYHDYRVIVNREPADVWGKLRAGRGK